MANVGISPDRLLPPQASPLERALIQIAPDWDALAGVGANLEAKRPAAFAPWLAAEWDLARFAGIFDDASELIERGLPWLFERGSAASVRRVLGWLGYEAHVRIEEDDAYLHLDLGRIATAEEIERIAEVVRASLPAHMRFYRVFFAHDLRPVVLDRGPALGAGQLDDDSGVWRSGIKASFADRRCGVLELTRGEIQHAITARRTAVISYDDRLLLDAWRLDSHLLVDSYGGLCELFTGECSRARPAAPERADAVARSGQAGWSAPPPTGQATQLQTAQLDVATLPPRAWSGPWTAPWRPFIELHHTEEL